MAGTEFTPTVGEIVLPRWAKNLLNKDEDYALKVRRVALEFKKLGNAINDLTFFEDYTQHGFDHQKYTAETAFKLIDTGGRKAFTTEDVGALYLACMIHDAGMYLNREHFHAIFEGEFSQKAHKRLIISDRPDITWNQLYRSFLGEVRHWDDKQLRSIHKDYRAEWLHFKDEKLDLELNFHRRLAGEFIRRHHPLLAYDIIVFGLPNENNPNENHLNVALNNLGEDFRAVVGFIAYSHGRSLRDCKDMFQDLGKSENWHILHPLNTHTTYLMALVRLSDYMNIHPERAAKPYRPSPLSEVSLLEIKKHQCIQSLKDEEPDVLRVCCKWMPYELFLMARNLLNDFQRELDMSWAVLGEVYGRTPMGFKYRRVRSEILDFPQHYCQKNSIDYLPKEFSLGVNQTEMIKLMIRPLYGDRPEVGIRELIQNAVDAVRERWDYEKHHLVKVDDPDLDCDVEVLLTVNNPAESPDYATLQVTDKGIGMTEEVIGNYFLVAGASFRRSLAWRKEFEREQTGENEIKSRVMRAGRFGIGIFAAFLLGEEIRVTTRHIGAEEGLTFCVKHESDSIEIRRCPKAKTGTKIEIGLTKQVFDQLHENGFSDWDWYCLQVPRVKRWFRNNNEPSNEEYPWFNGEIHELPQMCMLPKGLDAAVADGLLRQVKIPGVDGVYYSILTTLHNNVLNGIKIGNEGHTSRIISRVLSRLHLRNVTTTRVPNFIFLDSDGRIPVTIQRDSILWDEPELITGLIVDIQKSLLAYCLSIPDGYGVGSSIDNTYTGGIQRRLSFTGNLPICYMKNGYSLLDHPVLTMTNPEVVILCFDNPIKERNNGPKTIATNFIIEPHKGEMICLLDVLGQNSLIKVADLTIIVSHIFRRDIESLKLLAPTKGIISIGDDKNQGIGESESSETKEGFKYYKYGKPAREINVDRYRSLLESGAVIVEVTLDTERTVDVEYPLNEVWDPIIGKGKLIPFKRADRERLFPEAYREFAPMIALFDKLFKGEELDSSKLNWSEVIEPDEDKGHNCND